MNRYDLQSLAEARVLDAEALLNAGRWSGAYYLTGYAVECALKACIAKMTGQYDFPDKTIVQRSYSHDLKDLLNVSGLKEQFEPDSTPPVGPDLRINWERVKDWNEGARYQQKSEGEARSLYQAVTDPTSGVLPWIKNHW